MAIFRSLVDHFGVLSLPSSVMIHSRHMHSRIRSNLGVSSAYICFPAPCSSTISITVNMALNVNFPSSASTCSHPRERRICAMGISPLGRCSSTGSRLNYTLVVARRNVSPTSGRFDPRLIYPVSNRQKYRPRRALLSSPDPPQKHATM